MRVLLSFGFGAILLLSMVVVGLLYGDSDQELIKKLGHRRYAQRELASKKLAERGEPVLPALRKAAVHPDDLEVRRRAEELVLTIMHQARVSKSTGLKMVIISPSAMLIGSPMTESNRRVDELQHQVRITEPFLLGKYEVTQKQYMQVMKHNPSTFSKDGKYREKIRKFNTESFPVESLSWFDAIEYCNRLSKLDGYKPYYSLTEVKRKEKSILSAKVQVLNSNGYRLPTEAEWEYSCRGWTTTPFNFGTRNTGKQANTKATVIRSYGGNYLWKAVGHPTTVGSYPASGWGLNDMHGNVAEWCWDWYEKSYYKKAPLKNPQGPETGTQRVARGGSWLVNQYSCRSASRGVLAPSQKEYHTGFRVARTP